MGKLIFLGCCIIETFIFNELNYKKLYKDLADKGFKVKIIDDGIFTSYNGWKRIAG